MYSSKLGQIGFEESERPKSLALVSDEPKLKLLSYSGLHIRISFNWKPSFSWWTLVI